METVNNSHENLSPELSKSDEERPFIEGDQNDLIDCPLKNGEKGTSEVSSDGGYASSSDEERPRDSVGEAEDEENGETALKKIMEKYHYDKVPSSLQQIILGANSGLPADYKVPVATKPEWLDMEKFRLGQEFARKYFIGVNYSQMMALYVLFALPDGLETLVFSENSSTPYTSFRRYLSTVVRVSSWYDHDLWSQGNPGFRNIQAVRAMHLNVSKRINSTPLEELQERVTLMGRKSKPPMWSTGLKDIVQQDFQSGCPFKVDKPLHNTVPGKVFVNQLDMSTTQFGFVGLMLAYPEKFGAAAATKEEFEGFIHLWRSIGYLLGIEDKYNFCAGTLDEVVERCRIVVEQWVKPNFLSLTEDWEHMSRCLAEGMSYCTSAPVMSFEVSLMYLCWVLDVPAPTLSASLDFSHHLEFLMLKFMMTGAVRMPGFLPFLNWFMRRALVKAASMPPEELKKLENKTYDYQITQGVQSEVRLQEKDVAKTGGGIAVLALIYVLRLLI